MLPLWLVYLLIVLILILDVLLFVGLAAAVAILVGSFVLGLAVGLVEKKIDREIKGRLKGNELLKAAYSVLHLFLNAFLAIKGLPATLLTLAFVLAGGVVFVAINLALAWLLYTYVL
ncbi:MAG TPA: hypothetical protein VLT35_04775 [Methanocella sp.]|nr:hypothetical protein [Methanocella sp.]